MHRVRQSLQGILKLLFRKDLGQDGRLSGGRKRGIEFKGGSLQDRNHHNRRNREKRHGRLLVLYFEAQAKEGLVLSSSQNCQNCHEDSPASTQPPLSDILRLFIFFESGFAVLLPFLGLRICGRFPIRDRTLKLNPEESVPKV